MHAGVVLLPESREPLQSIGTESLIKVVRVLHGQHPCLASRDALAIFQQTLRQSPASILVQDEHMRRANYPSRHAQPSSDRSAAVSVRLPSCCAESRSCIPPHFSTHNIRVIRWRNDPRLPGAIRKSLHPWVTRTIGGADSTNRR